MGRAHLRAPVRANTGRAIVPDSRRRIAVLAAPAVVVDGPAGRIVDRAVNAGGKRIVRLRG